MPTVCHKGQRAEHGAADDLADHHDGSQAHNRPNALGVLVVTRAEENVLVLEGLYGVAMH
jgi:hypothetical protein